MLKWAIIFFIIAIIAGLFGFTNIYTVASSFAKILFFIALAGFAITLIFYLLILLKIF